MKSLAIACMACTLMVLSCFGAAAQNQTGDTNASSAPSPAAPAAEQQLLKPAELDGLLAPIALYPDPLLANVLTAATYPLEVVRAARWLDENKDLKGDQLEAATQKQDWDDSVKALVATPTVLQMMSEQLDWTQKVGEAFLAQQQDVMDSIQRLRAKAYDRDKLSSSSQQIVTARQEDGRRVIGIEPAVADTVYVPYYEPAVVYGDWPYSDYPAYPYYWGAPGYIGAGVLASGIAFGSAWALGRWATGGWWGGNRINWRGGDININRGGRVEHWQHDPQHRQGARYNNASLQQRFGNANRPGADRANVGDRGNIGDRGSLGNRGGGAGRGAAAIGGAAAGAAAGAGIANAARGRQGGAAARQAAGGRQGAAGRQAVGTRQATSRGAATRGRSGGATRNVAPRQAANLGAARGGGRESFASARTGGGGGRVAGGGARMGGGGMRAGGGMARGGGGRRSDIKLKHDIVLLGQIENGLGFYRFAYNGSDKAYVGVMAQEVQSVMPEAVTRGRDGYLRVSYGRLGLPFQSYDHWLASGGKIPAAKRRLSK